MDIGYRVDGMTVWNDHCYSFLTNETFCLPVQHRVPQLVYTNKTGDCLFIYLFVYLFAYGVWTAKPQGLPG